MQHKFFCDEIQTNEDRAFSDLLSRQQASVFEPTMLFAFRHSAKSSIVQEEHLATSPSLVTRLHLPRAIVVRSYVCVIDVVILTPETTGSFSI